jgi:hypothetical protein
MFPRPGEASDMWASSSWRVYGDGNTKVAVTALERIPDFLALIIQDERTIGKTVFCWEDEITQNRGWELAKQMRPDIDWASCRTNVRSSRNSPVSELTKAHHIGLQRASPRASCRFQGCI